MSSCKTSSDATPIEPTVLRRAFMQTGLAASATGLLALNACSAIPTARTGGESAQMTVALSAQGAVPQNIKALPPILFVHGNGDNASIWQTVIWRFESNGWPRERLHAINFALPSARTDDTLAQAGRSGSEEQTRELAAEIDRVLALNQAEKLILVGNSRGGFSIRNYIRNGGRTKVMAAILGGVPNHGIWKGSFNPNSEFNASGPFLTRLNSAQGPDGLEVTPGVAFLTVRSNNFDKYAQPLGTWLGQPKMETGVTHEGPALKGARNLVLPGKDHREVSFHADAFAEGYRFLTGHAPRTLAFAPEIDVRLSGKILGLHAQGGTSGEPVNLPLPGASLSIFELDAASALRKGVAVFEQKVGADGLWGPFRAKVDARYEFVVEAPGFAITHIYRSPFPRSSNIVHLRPARLAESDRDGYSVVNMVRPRGYFGLGRDKMSFDGQASIPGVPPGVPGVATSKLKILEPRERAVAAVFNQETIVVRSWPLQTNHIVFAEFTD